MFSTSGRYVLTCIGEIYNNLEVRSVLGVDQDRAWRGHVDTETLQAAFSRDNARAAVDLQWSLLLQRAFVPKPMPDVRDTAVEGLVGTL